MNDDKLIEFYLGLHEKGLPVPEEWLLKLRELDLIGKVKEGKPQKHKTEYHRDYTKSIEDEIAELENTMVTATIEFDDIVSEDEYKHVLKTAMLSGRTDIQSHEWMIPEEQKLEPKADFVKWINAINEDFRLVRDGKVTYERFNLYRQQAYSWLDGCKYIEDFNSIHDKVTWLKDTERPRCKENSLYFLNKYLILKEGTIDGGGRKYKAWLAHEILCFLFDCGISFMLGKGRQIGATSTIGGLFLKRILFHPNYFAKFITQDEAKGVEIFGDKIKFPLSQLGELKPGVLNDRDNLLWLGNKPEKGRITGINSKLQVSAPNVFAINGGSPDLVGIDEIGNISILTEMLNEGRPTMFHVDPETQQLKFVRQVLCWGTGGETEKGGKAFEREFYALLDQWNAGNYQMGMVPLFFNVYAKQGMTEEFLEKEKIFYYSRQGPDSERSRIQYHQHNPISIEDMFLTSAKTLIPIDEINRHLKRIHSVPHVDRQQYGFFLPIFDFNKPMPEGAHTPYKVIAAEWVPCEEGDHRCSTIIWEHPEEGWLNRYYKGTDPIMTDSGLSNQSSAIYDKYNKTIAACVRFRPNYHKDAYLQSMLLGLYYGIPPELVEGNIGTGYINYLEIYGLYNSVVPNTMLPLHLQGGATKDGIDKRRGRSSRILNNLKDMLYMYIDNIYIEEWFIELKTFVSKPTQSGDEKFEPINKNYYRDDFLDAGTYAYICAELVYAGKEPVDPEETKRIQRKKVTYRYEYDANFRLKLRKKLA